MKVTVGELRGSDEEAIRRMKESDEEAIRKQ